MMALISEKALKVFLMTLLILEVAVKLGLVIYLINIEDGNMYLS